MEKNNTITEEKIIEYYIDYVLSQNEEPKSVYIFAKTHKFSEQKFYEHFSSFQALEQSIFKHFFDHTHKLLEKSDDFTSFDSRNKLLSFYYTYFELLNSNRSYVIYALNKHKNNLKSLESLKLLKQRFINFINHLDIKTIDLKNERLDKIQTKSLEESSWLQFLITLKFWLEDTSSGFEKTDIFIEKSVHASFDLIDTTPLKSVIDLGKFLFKEKIKA